MRKYLQRCRLAVESAVNFSWLSCPSRLYEILIFIACSLFAEGVRWHNGGLLSARLDDGLNTVGRCITVWNLSAVAVVTGPTSRYSCITCLRVAMSGILSGGLRAPVYVFTHTRAHCCWIRNAMDYRDTDAISSDLERLRPLIRENRSMLKSWLENHLYIKRFLINDKSLLIVCHLWTHGAF